MKKLLLILLCALASLTLLADSFPTKALPQTWFVGERPSEWAQDELYLIECWATWCKPCIRAMPHMEELWQATKDKGVHILGISIDYGRTPDSLIKFLQDQPVPPTYPMGLEPNGEAFKEYVAIRGVPFAFAVRNGEIVWKGHPNSLTPEILLALRAGEPLPNAAPKSNASKPNTLQETEKAIDALAAQGKFEEAAQRQREFVLALPAQRRLSAPYVPEDTAVTPVFAPVPDTTVTSSEGDLAPYAELLGRPLPADDALTILSCQTSPGYGRDKPTYSMYMFIPGVMETQAVQQPYRVLYVADTTARERLDAYWAQIPEPRPALQYCDNLAGRGLFGESDQARPPYLAVFRKGRLIYKGPAESAPDALKKTFTTAEDYQAAVKADVDREARHIELLKQMFQAKTPAESSAIFDSFKDETLSSGVAAFLVPNFFADAYRAQDIEEGIRRYRALLGRFSEQSNALTMLAKMTDSWPELRRPLSAELAETWANIARLTQPYDPTYATAAWSEAADIARQAGNRAQAEAFYKHAIETAPATLRYQQLRKGQPATPSH